MKHDPTLSVPDCSNILLLRPRDALRVDPGPISQLIDSLGEIGAEEVICRALEDLTRHLRRMRDFHGASDFASVAERAKTIVELADHIGLPILAKVARDVAVCVTNGDDTAVAATFARLTRLADMALFEVGTLQNQGT